MNGSCVPVNETFAPAIGYSMAVSAGCRGDRDDQEEDGASCGRGAHG